MAKDNPLKISPPKIKIENRANNVVTDVIRVRDKVSLIDRLPISIILYFSYLVKFSLILS